MENEFVACRLNGLKDVFEYPKLESGCFRNTFFENHQKFLFNSLPHMKNYFAGVPRDRFAMFLNGLEKSSRQGLVIDDPMETDTLRMMSSIAQYAESLFLRFDKDQNNVVTNEEFKKALEHLVPNIRRSIYDGLDAGTIKSLQNFFPKFEENLIKYIIEKKEIPALLTAEVSFFDATGKAALLVFKEWSNLKDAVGWTTEYNIVREDIILVISALSTYGRVSRVKKMKQVFVDYEMDFDGVIQDPKHPVFDKLAEYLQCSSHIEPHLMTWLFENQKTYFADALAWFGIRTDILTIQVDQNDVMGAGAPFGSWEDTVTFKLIESIYKDPIMGPLCNVPYREGLHRVSRDQTVYGERCYGALVPICIPELRRQPY